MDSATSISRRDFLRGRREPAPRRILPPGVTAEALSACTGCGLCAESCPQHIITMAGGLPAVDFAQGECTFCGACARVCPEPVFMAGEALRFSHVAAIADTCLARRRIDCQACRDACPEQAIRFRPRLGGPFLPEIDEDACSGCGACIGVCPAAAIDVHPKVTEAADA